MTKQIPLTKGKVALVSDHRYEYLTQWSWHAKYFRNKWYAERKDGLKNIKMHRQIMEVTDPKIKVDHRDGDGLNNQDDNLRVCTNAQNLRNRGKTTSNTSGFKGVSSRGNSHRARITVNYVEIHLGSFSDPETAARAYDNAARQLHGPFASTNFKEG